MVAYVDTSQRPDHAATAAPRRPSRRWIGYLVLAFILSWVVPPLAHVIRVDWLLPPLLLVGTASLLRGGRTLLDRLILAFVLLVSATTAAGLLFSHWPWNLEPVPVAIAGFTALTLIAALTRRRPVLPRSLRPSDIHALISGVAITTLVVLPFLPRDLTGRIALILPGEDNARHFTLFDSIHRFGGYVYFHNEAAAPYVTPGLENYPQGFHMVTALLDNFVRSTTELDTPLNAFGHYTAFTILGYGLFALVMVWATGRVAATYLSGWRMMAVCTFTAAAVGVGPVLAMFVRGYPSEILGLTLLAVLFTLLARPIARTRELIVMVAALLVGIAFTYFFLMPIAMASSLLALIVYRRRVLRSWPTVLISIVIAAPLALVPYLMMYANANPIEDLSPDGGVVPLSRNLVVAVTVLICAGLLLVWRSITWRMVVANLVITAAFALAIGTYQIIVLGELAYYFEKAVHAVFVACLVGLGACALLIPQRPHLQEGGTRGPLGALVGTTRRRSALVATLLCLTPLAMFGVIPIQRPAGTNGYPAPGVSWGAAWAAGNLEYPLHALMITAVLEHYPDGEADDRINVVVHPDGKVVALFTGVLRREHGSTDDFEPWTLYTRDQQGVDNLTELLLETDTPVRLIVADINRDGTREVLDEDAPPRFDVEGALRQFVAEHPELDIELMRMSDLTDPSS